MNQVRVVTDSELSVDELNQIRSMVFAAFGTRLTDADWAHTRGGHRVLVMDGGAVVSHAAIVPRRIQIAAQDFKAGYLEAVATHLSYQRRGHGSRALTRATQLLQARFELGVLSTSKHHFYESGGWERWQGPSYVSQKTTDGEELLRTPDEDHGLMVLRFGPSGPTDLGSAIACDARPGDDW